MKEVLNPVITLVISFGLRNLIIVMGETEVDATDVDVNGPFLEVLGSHAGALDVPAGSALAPGGGPAGLTLLALLPQGKIKEVPFLLVFNRGEYTLTLLE